MTAQAGIWLDYTKAIAILLDGRHVLLNIVEPPPDRSGKKRTRYNDAMLSVAYPDGPGDDDEASRTDYFDKIYRRIKPANDLILIGPGQAKKEFQQYAQQRNPEIRLRECRSLQPMGSREVVRYVCKFFNHPYS